MTRNEFLKWAKRRAQWTLNEVLHPHNPDVADSEIIEVVSWDDFVSLIHKITEGRIEIVEEGER